ncbi:MAG: transporter [Deltaproteobacteria bacterium]|nr:transporter [Deltaproteobacteria bacterium]
MSWLADALSQHELLLLAVVLLVGVPLGRLTVLGVRLGVAGVLFAGLGLAALAANEGVTLHLAPALRDLGLVLFVYCIGLQSGPGFFRAFRQRGVAINLAVLVALAAAAGVAVLGGLALDLDRGHLTGVFCGALTNTPALAAAAERLQGSPLSEAPAIGYSVAYPFGVLGAILTLRLFARLTRTRLARERAQAESARASLVNADLRVTRPELFGKAIGELRVRDVAGVMISRLRRGDETIVPTKYTALQRGDVVVVVGPAPAVEAAAAWFGERSREHLEAERGQIDMRRILVSRRELVGKRIEELDLARLGAQVTRLRRADLDLLPSPEMRLELGDRIRVVAPPSRMAELTRLFGDSERDLAQLDFVALAVGLALGLMLAQLAIPGPGGVVKLGIAGGPLIVALVLGRLGRTGPLVWSLPYESSTTLRDLGLLLFLAGVGVSAGAHIQALPGEDALAMLGLGALVTVVASLVMLLVVHRVARGGVVATMGATTGLQTQPASLAVAYDLSGRVEETYVTYAIAFPVAMIGKILSAQLLVMLL